MRITSDPSCWKIVGWVLLCWAVARILYGLEPALFQVGSDRWVDMLMRYETARKPSEDNSACRIAHVDIDNHSFDLLQAYFQNPEFFYLDRAMYAQAMENLGHAELAAQLWDFLMPGRINKEQDDRLARAAQQCGNVYFGMAFRPLDQANAIDTTDPGPMLEIEKQLGWNIQVASEDTSTPVCLLHRVVFLELAQALKGQGHLMSPVDIDGVHRRIPLLVRHQDRYFPCLALRVACDWLNVPPTNLVLYPGKSLLLKNAVWPEGRRGHLRIPIDTQGNLRVHFIGPWGSRKHYTFAQIWNASHEQTILDQLRDVLKGSIVVVAETAIGSGDIGVVPTDEVYPLAGIHANALHTILNQGFIRSLPLNAQLGIEFGLAFLLILFGVRLKSTGYVIASLLLGLVFLIVITTLYLAYHLVVPISCPVLESVLGFFVVMIYRYQRDERNRAVLRNSFEAYFPSSVVKRILQTPGRITSGGHVKELTVLFSDISDFTRHSKFMAPGQVQQVLNRYFEKMVDIVFESGGTLDKFIGDGLMVFFGDPEPQTDHALRAVHAAIAMQQEVSRLPHEPIPVKIRIGINTGEVIVGNMGASRRLSYTVIGPAVNLACRLENHAPTGSILVSERTYQLVKDQIAAHPIPPLQVKGFDQPVTAYLVENQVQGPNTCAIVDKGSPT